MPATSRRFIMRAALGALLGAGLMSARGAYAADNVSVALAYTPWATELPIYVAIAKGVYKKAGLNVTVKPNQGSAATILVGSGQEEFGFIDPAAALTARSKGVPVVVLANAQQANGAALFATQKSGISKIEDLRGKNVGAFTGSQTTIFLQALLNKHKMSMSDVNIVTTRSGTDLPLVLNGGIDAEVTIYNNELVSWGIQYPDLKLKIWQMSELGFDTPGYAILTSEKLLKEKPDVAKRFTNATLEGLDYALKNPEEAVKALVAAVPVLKPNLELAKWNSLRPTATSPATEKGGLGAIDQEKWDHLNDLLLTYKVIDKKVDLAQMLNDSVRSRIAQK